MSEQRSESVRTSHRKTREGRVVSDRVEEVGQSGRTAARCSRLR